MTNQLKNAFEKALCLSEEEQNDLAAALLLVVDNKLSPEDETDEAEWDALVGSARSQALLEKMVAKAQKAVERGEVSDFHPGNLTS